MTTILHPLTSKPRPFLITCIIRICWRRRVIFIQIRSSIVVLLQLISWLKNMLPTMMHFSRTSPGVWLKWAESSRSLEAKERSEPIAEKSIKKYLIVFKRMGTCRCIKLPIYVEIMCDLSSPWRATMFINKHLVRRDKPYVQFISVIKVLQNLINLFVVTIFLFTDWSKQKHEVNHHNCKDMNTCYCSHEYDTKILSL